MFVLSNCLIVLPQWDSAFLIYIFDVSLGPTFRTTCYLSPEVLSDSALPLLFYPHPLEEQTKFPLFVSRLLILRIKPQCRLISNLGSSPALNPNNFFLLFYKFHQLLHSRISTDTIAPLGVPIEPRLAKLLHKQFRITET